MGRRTSRPRVLLVAMPWARLEHPSIQLGILKALLDAAGIASIQQHLYLDFAAHLTKCTPPLGVAAYGDVAAHYFAGDWIFSIPPFRPPGSGGEYLDFLRAGGTSEEFIHNIAAMREIVPECLEHAVSRLVALQPAIV